MANKWIEFVKKWALDKHISYRDAIKDPKLKKAYNKKYPKDIKGSGQSSSKAKVAPKTDMKEVERLLAESAERKYVEPPKPKAEPKARPIDNIEEINAINPNSPKEREKAMHQKIYRDLRNQRFALGQYPLEYSGQFARGNIYEKTNNNMLKDDISSVSSWK